MKVLLRADGNGEIGYGHLSRLNAFSDILGDEFEKVFLTREDTGVEIINRNVKIKLLPKGLSVDGEIKWMAEHFSSKNHIIIADGYQFNSSYQKKVKDLGYKLIFIDDLVKFHMHADCVINHAISLEENQYSGEKYVRYFLGSEYALLRSSFIESSKSRAVKDIKLETAFVSFGGTNSSKITRSAVNSLLSFNTFKKIYVVVGKSFADGETIEFLNKNIRTELFVDIDEKTMSKIMCKADFAIVPSSTISYELASSRCIIASGFTTENQFYIYEGLRNKNIIFALGDISSFEEKDFNAQLEIILTSKKEVFQKKTQNQIKYFNGNQKERLVNIINSLEVKS
jgi:UDP-2,4-diacetamido-2,4,6-trideoxy-beta-L-altropyranose hydrolase